MPNPACAAYEAYRAKMNSCGTTGVYLCPWNMLSEIEQLAWWEVVWVLVPKRKDEKK